jgi:hypothetical protein
MNAVQKRQIEINKLEDDMLSECAAGLSGRGDINKIREMRSRWKELTKLEMWRLNRKIRRR